MTTRTTLTRPVRALVLAAALGACAPAGDALAQYRWLDANGRVHYGDAPPRDAKDVRALGAGGAPAAAAEDPARSLPYEVRRAVERAPVVLYTSPDCQPCAPAAALLRDRGVPYQERSIVTTDDLQEFRRISGGLRLPHLTVGRQPFSGFEPEGWHRLLDAAGYPKGSLLPRSFQWPAPQPLVSGAAPSAAQPPAGDGAAAPARDKPSPASPAQR